MHWEAPHTWLWQVKEPNGLKSIGVKNCPSLGAILPIFSPCSSFVSWGASISKCNSRIMADVHENLDSSAKSSPLFIEFEFDRVSNCWVRTCNKVEFCLSISTFGSSNMNFSDFFKLEFNWVWLLRVKTWWVFEFRVAWFGTILIVLALE